MKIENNLSSGSIQLILGAGGLMLVYLLWVGLAKVAADIRYEPVYGENFGTASANQVATSLSLPIVVASQPTNSKASVVASVSDDLIEAAFREPQLNVIEDTESDKPKALPLSTTFMLAYRPVVGGLADGGVFLNGRFVRYGESIQSMPIRTAEGVIVYPRLSKVSRKEVTFTLGDSDSAVLPLNLY